MGYTLSDRSIGFMAGLHPDLLRVVRLAITLTDQDFGVTERQVRTREYQQTLVQRGVSKTMRSNHLQQVDLTGKTHEMFGHAVDLVPYADGKFVWDWARIYHVAAAMAEAARRLDLLGNLCWGGVWDRWMSGYDCATPAQVAAAERAYCQRHAGPDFVDGPHYQIYKRG